ncbi:N-formylglutamate amidohydrolase [Falsihalocynthiibacter sp. S25ZX9]|uniref:N-formylglutamate amidohydrolase n=1 Tax=Falsihalocynthiibacter sp. S25ZX9 TaxID=3240870 RepID=UPI00351096C7
MLRLEDIEGKPAVFVNREGATPIAIVCEHASRFIPTEFDGLGLTDVARESHAAWDPGAFDVAQMLALGLNAPLVASGVSRLVYDCNRPPEALDAMPAKSEQFDVPGNLALTEAQRAARTKNYYVPFFAALTEMMATGIEAIVTVHSFTPIYHGTPRAVELGFLHDSDSRLADAMLKNAPQETTLLTLRNEPYGPEHGVTHTLKVHGVENGVANVMLEIRNDLLESPEQRQEIAHMLLRILRKSLNEIGVSTPQGSTE